MNVREGSRRLALLLGSLGLLGGIVASAMLAGDYVRGYKEHREFVRLQQLPEVKQVLEAKSKEPIPSGNPWDLYAARNDIAALSQEVKQINFRDSTAGSAISSFETKDGRFVYDGGGIAQFFVLPVLPILGFFLPYFVVTALAWVVIGFTK